MLDSAAPNAFRAYAGRPPRSPLGRLGAMRRHRSEPIAPDPRTVAAGEVDDDERVVAEAELQVH